MRICNHTLNLIICCISLGRNNPPSSMCNVLLTLLWRIFGPLLCAELFESPPKWLTDALLKSFWSADQSTATPSCFLHLWVMALTKNFRKHFFTNYRLIVVRYFFVICFWIYWWTHDLLFLGPFSWLSNRFY